MIAVWLGLAVVLIAAVTVWWVVRAGRDDGPDARVLGLVAPVAPDSRPLSTIGVLVSEGGPILFGARSAALEIHPSALVFRGSAGEPLVVPLDRIGRIELRGGLTGSRATIVDARGRRSGLSFLVRGSPSRLREALAAGGVLGLVDET